MVVGISKIALHSRYQRVFILQSLKILNVFNTLTKNGTLFERLEHLFFVKSSKIENATFPYKTVPSETNVRTNRMTIKHWTFRKNGI